MFGGADVDGTCILLESIQKKKRFSFFDFSFRFFRCSVGWTINLLNRESVCVKEWKIYTIAIKKLGMKSGAKE